MASQALTKAALWMQNVDYPAQWDRALFDAMYATEGVISGFAVTPNGGLGIAVSAGVAVVQGDEVANQGKYLIDQDAVTTLTLASVGTTRTEYVWISINDTAVSGGRAGDNVSIETSTTAPPASALLLATLSLPAGTSTITAGMIADSRAYTSVIAPSSVITSMIADLNVTTPKIADSAVTSAKIANGTIATVDIADEAVGTAKIALGAVTEVTIAAGAVSLFKLEASLQAWIAAADPADAITAIAGSTAPPGWALCDGATYSRSLYPATFARLNAAGLPYGAGDGSLTFHVPDLRSRFIAGRGAGHAWSTTLAGTSGFKDAQLVDHQHAITAHTHPVSVYGSGGTSTDGSHAHIETYQGSSQGWLYRSAFNGSEFDVAFVNNGLASGYGYAQPSTGTAGSTHAHGFGLTSTGTASGNSGINTTGNTAAVVAAADRNLPPYMNLNYCIRLR